jgi:hypothetical protein
MYSSAEWARLEGAIAHGVLGGDTARGREQCPYSRQRESSLYRAWWMGWMSAASSTPSSSYESASDDPEEDLLRALTRNPLYEAVDDRLWGTGRPRERTVVEDVRNPDYDLEYIHLRNIDPTTPSDLPDDFGVPSPPPRRIPRERIREIERREFTDDAPILRDEFVAWLHDRTDHLIEIIDAMEGGYSSRFVTFGQREVPIYPEDLPSIPEEVPLYESHRDVEPVGYETKHGWWVDFEAVGGPLYGPFKTSRLAHAKAVDDRLDIISLPMTGIHHPSNYALNESVTMQVQAVLMAVEGHMTMGSAMSQWAHDRIERTIASTWTWLEHWRSKPARTLTGEQARKLLLAGKPLPNLEVVGDLVLSYSSRIARLPAGLHVDGSLYLRGTPITSLPADLRVEEWIIMPDGRMIPGPSVGGVGGSVLLTSKQARAMALAGTLPENSWVGDDLDLSHYTISGLGLPEGLHVGGDLNLRGTLTRSLFRPSDGLLDISSLPERLHVGGRLFLSNTLIYRLPADLRVKMTIFMPNNQEIQGPSVGGETVS